MDPLESKVRSTSASPNSVHGGTVGASVTTIGPNVGSVVGAAVGRTLGLAVGTCSGAPSSCGMPNASSYTAKYRE
jgi:phage tail tape-measure protein